MKRLTIEVAHDVGDIVYVNTDSDQSKYIVMSYVVKPTHILYEIYSHDNGYYTAYDYELTTEKEIMI
jgi:hypothetical protein